MSSLTPYICCKDAPRAIEFYTQAFGAKETMRLAEPSGKIGHAEVQIGDARLMLSDEHPDHGALSPKTIGGTPVVLHLYVDDADATVKRAAAAGAKVLIPVADQFYGDRSGRIEDPSGHIWIVSAKKENLDAAEVQRRYDKMLAG